MSFVMNAGVERHFYTKFLPTLRPFSSKRHFVFLDANARKFVVTCLS
ncbi:hypothetical protein AB434_1516 [Heyndrickxia coagulans]|uniref:Uncharacterized protein n=1 Tax=Heyndrickxia coagulans TaxID=1398 RepID=A0AAN0T831_HEYCO|nr:hypothetical protein SB48_HM08orf06093 [Heyndrickxia coagulans]AKN53921.1 hypothetical protein AB434_1516 [Heyndrickxia coagulans]